MNGKFDSKDSFIRGYNYGAAQKKELSPREIAQQFPDVDADWISDGFELTEDNLRDAILSQLLPYAYEHEVAIKILAAPAEETIASVQGDSKFLPASNSRQFRKVRKSIQAVSTAWR